MPNQNKNYHLMQEGRKDKVSATIMMTQKKLQTEQEIELFISINATSSHLKTKLYYIFVSRICQLVILLLSNEIKTYKAHVHNRLHCAFSN